MLKIYNKLAMPLTKNARELSYFQRVHVIRQSESGFNQLNIAENPQIPLSTVNRIIVQLKTN